MPSRIQKHRRFELLCSFHFLSSLYIRQAYTQTPRKYDSLSTTPCRTLELSDPFASFLEVQRSPQISSTIMAPCVASMVQRIELEYAPVGAQVKNVPLRWQPGTTHALPSRPKPLVPNNSYSIPNFSRPRLSKQNPDVFSRDSMSPMAPDVVQTASSSAAPKERKNSQILKVKSKQSSIRIKVELESSDESESDQSPGQPVNWPLVDVGLWFPGCRTPLPTACTPVRRHTPVKIKTEHTSHMPAMTEISRGSMYSVTTKAGFPIRVPSLLAEQYYRSVLTKIEEDEELATTEAESARLNQDFDSLTKSLVKSENSPSASSPTFHNNLDTVKLNLEPSQTIHRPKPTNLLPPTNPRYNSSPDRAISLLPTCTSPSPESMFSFLKPTTPSPFSTAYGVPNTQPYAPNITCVPGSLLENKKRPTKWAHGGYPDKPARHLPQPDRMLPIAREYGCRSANSLLQAHGRKTGKLCAWIKQPFLKNPRRSKWCAVDALRKHRKAVQSADSHSDTSQQMVTTSKQVGDVWRRDSAVSTTAPWIKGTRKAKWWQFGRGKLTRVTAPVFYRANQGREVPTAMANDYQA